MEPPSKISMVISYEFNVRSLKHHLGVRSQVLEYLVNQRDEIRKKDSLFPSCVKYSSSKGAICYSPYYSFNEKESGCLEANVFTTKDLEVRKKSTIENSIYAFVNHVENDFCSPHNTVTRASQDLLNQFRIMDKFISEPKEDQIVKNWLRLQTSVDKIHWLIF
ncbi:hypothetical protein NMG60_11021621 [Bertholletia excelsa]